MNKKMKLPVNAFVELFSSMCFAGLTVFSLILSLHLTWYSYITLCLFIFYGAKSSYSFYGLIQTLVRATFAQRHLFEKYEIKVSTYESENNRLVSTIRALTTLIEENKVNAQRNLSYTSTLKELYELSRLIIWAYAKKNNLRHLKGQKFDIEMAELINQLMMIFIERQEFHEALKNAKPLEIPSPSEATELLATMTPLPNLPLPLSDDDLQVIKDAHATLIKYDLEFKQDEPIDSYLN